MSVDITEQNLNGAFSKSNDSPRLGLDDEEARGHVMDERRELMHIRMALMKIDGLCIVSIFKSL